MKVMAHQPSYWPTLHVLHRMAYADTIIMLDRVKFSRDANGAFHQRAEMPSGLLSVPIQHGKSGEERTWGDVACVPDGWQSRHLRLLQKWYPEYAFNLMDAMTVIGEFPLHYCEGIRRVNEVLLNMLPPERRPTVVWQSDLDMNGNMGAQALFSLVRKVGGTAFICGRYGYETYMGGVEAFNRVKLTPLVQNVQFPAYADRRDQAWNWSALDLLAMRGALWAQDYFATLAQEGWLTE